MTVTERKALSRYRGIVASRSGDKSIRVQLDYQVRHPKYGKILKRRTIAHVHDEQNEANQGDLVEITKCRPYSKTKTWRLLCVVEADEEA